LESEVLYRAIPKWAVISLVLGILGVVAFLDPYLALVPLLGVLLGWAGLRQIAKQPRDYTGRPLALAGIALSAAMLVAGVATQIYIYQTEVPEGYNRISYTELQPPPFAPEGSVPKSALSLDGKQVFIKGYVYPTRQQTNIKKFVLCRDNGDCCFGGEPKLTDKILVELKDPLELTYSMRQFKLAGTFKVLPADSDDVGQVVYQL
jgi:hypothetical protein